MGQEELPAPFCRHVHVATGLHNRRLYQQPHLSAVLGATQRPQNAAGRPHTCPPRRLSLTSRCTPLCSHQPSPALPLPTSLSSLRCLSAFSSYTSAHHHTLPCLPDCRQLSTASTSLVQHQSHTSPTPVPPQSHSSPIPVPQQSHNSRTAVPHQPHSDHLSSSHALLPSCPRLVARSRHLLRAPTGRRRQRHGRHRLRAVPLAAGDAGSHTHGQVYLV